MLLLAIHSTSHVLFILLNFVQKKQLNVTRESFVHYYYNLKC